VQKIKTPPIYEKVRVRGINVNPFCCLKRWIIFPDRRGMVIGLGGEDMPNGRNPYRIPISRWP
jgi:hypothetical protein